MSHQELAVITTYFNPVKYKSRRVNYDIFMAGMEKSGVFCLTVECAFGDDPFELQANPYVFQVRCATLLWQKERLLNLAASWLPERCKYVAWLDCDIVFNNKKWVGDLCDVLKNHQIAQVFETCVRREQHDAHLLPIDRSTSFASVMNSQPEQLHAGLYDAHGHTGYGWAMRRDIFDEVGLYESAISGSADHFMAHAIYGQYGFCIENALKHDHHQIQHLKAWGKRFYQKVKGSLGVVPGEIEHLWHGDTVNRRYFLRMHDITDRGFNPWTDLKIQVDRPMEWADNMQKPELRQYFTNYFKSRHEDGAVHLEN
jgi:hypothetical protein